ncbi:alpha/beta fold hydrolase [Saccharopolyspora erythraea]|uniref:alpha/beta hydrolase n=1 Tax=Saccharopolyspora erythraea TaxID=1836 RepID=UPI001BEEFA77|nr:alpha/beta hydrolase [Saccharopolyspora erythraea]QUH04736.1 alpha/beta fold hydrolase [Saccharopolyspora erythraea]
MTALRLCLTTALATSLLAAGPPAAAQPHFGPCPPGVASSDDNPAEAPVECATVDVPLDYGAPDGRTLPVAISRIRATGTPQEYRGALLVNPGGPGGSGLGYAAEKRAKLPEPVQRSFDVIGFDPRGVGRSAPVDCGPAGGLFQHPAPDPVPTDPASEHAYLGQLRHLAGDCARNVGEVLPHIGTANTARDMDVIRGALGQRELNFLGVSYGTYLGAAYAAQFPERTGRMVLDSVVSPDAWHDFDVQQGFAMIEQRDVLFRWIAANPSLGLGATPEEVRAGYTEARARLGAHPAAGGVGPAEFDRFVYRTLSRTERWEPFARALSAFLASGDASGFEPAEPEGDPESRNYEAALRTVKCADSVRTSADEVVRDVRALRAADPQPVLTGLEATTCAFWPAPRETARLGSPAMPPVMLTQAAHDPTTPPAGARRMQRVLPGSRMVTLDDSYSHGVFASQRNACVDDAAAAYLVSGRLPREDVECAGGGLPQVAG